MAETESDREKRLQEMVRSFAGRLVHHWKWWVSSSLLAVLFAFFQSGGVVMATWLIIGLGLSGIFVAAFYAWKDEYVARLKAQEALLKIRSESEEIWRPKIQITGTSRVLTPNEHDFDSVFRATIVSLGFNPVGSCVARLESIAKQGVMIFAHVETILAFDDSGAHYVGAKQLDYGIPAYLQIAGDKAGRLRIASNNHGRTLNPFADGQIQQAGDYEIKITLSAHGSVSVGASFLFRWTGDANTSSLHLTGQWPIAPKPPSPTPDKP